MNALLYFSPMPEESTPVVRPERQPEETREAPRGGPKNKYGDVWTQ